MKPFKFSLESLREPRRQKEQVSQQRYAQALADCDRAAAKLESAAIELKANRNLLSLELASGAHIDTINSLRGWGTVLENRRNKCKAAFDEARRAVETTFNEMIESSRAREALDCFHKKARGAYDRKVRTMEQKVLDEIALRFRDAGLLLQTAAKPAKS